MKWRISIGIALVILLVSVLTISCSQQAQKPVTIRIGLNEYTGDLPFFVAIEKGYFEVQGFNPQTTKYGNSSEALNALLAGQADVINPISFSALLAAEIKSPGEFKLFLPGGESHEVIGSYLLVNKDSQISSLDELKGKRIGTYTGATQLLYLKLFLKRIGLDPESDVTIVQVAPSLQAQALEAGQFDALFTIEPFSTIAIQKGIAKVLEENPRVKYIVNPFISGSAAVSTDFVKQNPAAMKKLLSATDKALDFIRENEREARQILGMKKYTPLGELSTKAGLLVWYKYKEPVNMDAIQKIADLLFDNGILSAKVNVQKLFLADKDLAK